MFNHRSNYRACNALSPDGKCVAARVSEKEFNLREIETQHRVEGPQNFGEGAIAGRIEIDAERFLMRVELFRGRHKSSP